jgi:nondiscriminating glutamyl-tRNA synthetase
MQDPARVRVRFAPSPTGWLHVGGLRTALYNYLFARAHGGSFILRIEDTDRQRYVDGALDNLITTLRWAGLTYDEGPDVGGPYGPYTQSQRLSLYREHVDRLVANGAAYPCFCTIEDLEVMRGKDEHGGTTQAYDRRCRMLDADAVRKRLEAGTTHTIRLAVPLIGEVTHIDAIRGPVTVSCGVLDDQVLLKSDGFPTYHLANVVDDHLMGITHVIRGEEWLPSTPKHILLYQSFGWDLPIFAHLPLLLNPDRSKLSKRQGDVAVEDYRDKGYLPEALVNFIALLGWNTAGDREMYSLDELVEAFTLEGVSKAGAVFDIDKLNWFNGQYVRSLPLDALAALCRPVFEQVGLPVEPDARYRTIIESVAKYLTVPADAIDHARIYFEQTAQPVDDEAAAVLGTESAHVVIGAMHEATGSAAEWNRSVFKDLLKHVQSTTSIKGASLYMPLRVALTGRTHGPDLPLVAEIFGRDICLQRLAAALG